MPYVQRHSKTTQLTNLEELSPFQHDTKSKARVVARVVALGNYRHL